MDEEVLSVIKSIASEGADLTAVETALTGYVKDPLGGINDKESAVKFIRDNPFLNSAFDSGISKGVESYKTNFSTKDLPELISAERQKIIAELNPEETKADKLAREFEEYKQTVQAKEQQGLLEKELISTFDKVKAVDNGFKAEDLQHFVNMGEKGVEQFVKLNERIAEITKTKIEEALKGKYVNKDTEPAGGQESTFDVAATMAGKKFL